MLDLHIAHLTHFALAKVLCISLLQLLTKTALIILVSSIEMVPVFEFLLSHHYLLHRLVGPLVNGWHTCG